VFNGIVLLADTSLIYYHIRFRILGVSTLTFIKYQSLIQHKKALLKQFQITQSEYNTWFEGEGSIKNLDQFEVKKLFSNRKNYYKFTHP
jgi:hypothetical protein